MNTYLQLHIFLFFLKKKHILTHLGYFGVVNVCCDISCFRNYNISVSLGRKHLSLTFDMEENKPNFILGT